MGGGSGRRKWEEEEECEKYKLRHVHCDLTVFFITETLYERRRQSRTSKETSRM